MATTTRRTVAVTGATGHLGNAVVRELLGQGLEVRALVEASDDGVALASLPVMRCRGDVLDLASLERAFEGVDAVFHLAGLVSITAGGDRRIFEVNVGGTRLVLQACRSQRVRRLVHVGSVHALVEPRVGVLDETAGFDPARSRGAYAASKAQACQEVLAEVAQGRLDAVLVLPSGCIGPWDFRLSEMGQLLVALAAGRTPLLVEGGYDWVDVRDVALGLAAASEQGRTGVAYLLGGEWCSLGDLARLVSAETGSRVPRVLPAWVARLAAAPAPLWERLTGRRALLTPYSVETVTSPVRLSIARARAELGFAPRPLKDSVADALAWHRSDPASPGNRRLAAPRPGRARPLVAAAAGSP